MDQFIVSLLGEHELYCLQKFSLKVAPTGSLEIIMKTDQTMFIRRCLPVPDYAFRARRNRDNVGASTGLHASLCHPQEKRRRKLELTSTMSTENVSSKSLAQTTCSLISLEANVWYLADSNLVARDLRPRSTR